MKLANLASVPLLVTALATPSFAVELFEAGAQIRGPGITGTLRLTQSSNSSFVLVNVILRGDPKILTPGLHGFHVHKTGSCRPSEGTPFGSAGGHHDPGPFGSSTPVEANHPYHLGDLPNIRVDKNGRGSLQTVTSRFTLSKGPLSLFNRDGSAVIVHKLTDQVKAGGTADQSGGARLACGIIKMTGTHR